MTLLNAVVRYARVGRLTRLLPGPSERVLREWWARRQIRAFAVVREWETPPCALCNRLEVVPHTSYHGFRIVRCIHDGLLFASPRPTDLQPFYTSHYYTGGVPGVYADYEVFTAENVVPRWKERIQRLEERLGRQGRLFDVGAATGAFLTMARDLGWDVSGIEMSNWAATQAAKLRSVSVRVGQLPDVGVGSAIFDAVTMWDCIEHVANPGDVLLDIHRVLKPEAFDA